jgi:macrolide transport system ATP-binding/permease protein
MSALRAFVARMKATLFRVGLDEQLDEEIQAHLDMQAEEFMRQGMSPHEARLAARRTFGGVDQIKESYRDDRGFPALDAFMRDLQYSVRLLGRAPGFAAVAIFTLAIGIGATTAVFTVLNRAFLQALPVADPDRLVALNNTAPNRTFPTFSYPNYVDIRERTRSFSALIAYRYAPLSVSHDGINERLWGYVVTGNYFDVLGVRPAIGRLLAPADDQVRSGHPLVVVTYKFWQQRMGGARDVVGRTLLANGRSYTIVGVTPQGFFGTEVVSAPELFFPMAMLGEIEGSKTWLDDRGVEILFVVGRLNPDTSRNQAQADVTAASMSLEKDFPRENEGKRITLSSPGLIGGMMRAPVLGFAGLLMVIAALVLLLACTNLANLLLARAADRRREMAVRLSLGAARRSLVRQLLTESLLLSAAAGALGFVLAWWLVQLAGQFELPVDIPLAIDLPIDRRVLLFNIVLSVLTGVLFGLVPALQATKADLVSALKDSTTVAPRHESAWKKGLIVVQVAVSLVLLIGGGLMLRSLAHAQMIPLGFTPERAAEVSFDLRLQGYEPAAGREFQRQLLERVRALPEVRHAALADVIPVDLHFGRARVEADGAVPEPSGRAPLAFNNRVTPGYFQAMETRLQEGRDFTAFDNDSSPRVAIVNRSFARRMWPGQSAVGRRFTLKLNNQDNRPIEVVGVAADGKYASLGESGSPMVYRPLWQSYSGSTTVIVRTDGDLPNMLAAVQREIHRLDPNIPIGSARTLTERLDLPLFPARMTAWILGSFGALALVLAAVGLYGVMSYMVSTRTHEIGVRMAMGARAADVLALILRQGLTLTAAGVITGVLLAVLLARLMRALLYGISSTDAPTYIAVVALLGLVALIACLVPARRATKMDPVAALRAE